MPTNPTTKALAAPPNAAEEITLDYVAKKSGVSRATASRALNGKPGVAADVRDRVRIVAESLNYRPNRAAKNLAGGRSSVVGLVLGSKLPGDFYGASLLQAMAEAADNFDEGLMLLTTKREPSQAVRNMLRDGLVDGVAVSARTIGERWIEELLDAQVPTVLLGAHPERTDVPVVDVENLESSAALVDHLFETGCERIAMLAGPVGRMDAELRMQGYRLAHVRRGRPVDESLIIPGDFTRATGYARSALLFKKEPDGIFAANDDSAIGIARAAAQQGISMPDDLSLVGFDGASSIEMAGPLLTTANQPFDELAHLAVSTLVALLEGESVPLEQFIDPQLSFGETTRSLPLANT